MSAPQSLTAFAGVRRLASGEPKSVLLAAKAHLDAHVSSSADNPLLIFDDETGRQVDFDFRGTPDEVLRRTLPPEPRSGPGRPKLGVVAREVTLLPRQWEWLETQRGGISAALRRLVDEARKREPDRERARRARDAAGTWMWNLAANLPNFEEASRALYAGDDARLTELTAAWPPDVREHLLEQVATITRLEQEDAAVI